MKWIKNKLGRSSSRSNSNNNFNFRSQKNLRSAGGDDSDDVY